MPNIGHFGECLITLRLQSNSVTRQFTFNRTKWWKMPKFECDILSIFKHCECYSLRSCKEVTMTQFVATFPTVQRLIFFYFFSDVFEAPRCLHSFVRAVELRAPNFPRYVRTVNKSTLVWNSTRKTINHCSHRNFFINFGSNNFIVSEVCKTSFRRR